MSRVECRTISLINGADYTTHHNPGELQSIKSYRHSAWHCDVEIQSKNNAHSLPVGRIHEEVAFAIAPSTREKIGASERAARQNGILLRALVTPQTSTGVGCSAESPKPHLCFFGLWEEFRGCLGADVSVWVILGDCCSSDADDEVRGLTTAAAAVAWWSHSSSPAQQRWPRRGVTTSLPKLLLPASHGNGKREARLSTLSTTHIRLHYSCLILFALHWNST